MLKKNIMIRPICKETNYNLPDIVLEEMLKMSDGWVKIDQTLENKPFTFVVKPSTFDPEVKYGFSFWLRPDLHKNIIFIAPVLVKSDENRIVRDLGTPIYCNTGDYTYDYAGAVESRLTIGIGKHEHTAFISIVPENSEDIIMSQIAGEDLVGNCVYGLVPATHLYEYWEAKPMAFYTIGSDMDHVTHEYSLNTRDYWREGDISMGALISSSKLFLAPFVNPTSGNVLEDIFVPIGGPKNSRLYDVSMGSRHFVTGASAPPQYFGGILTDQEYGAPFKMFMEV